MSHWAEVNTFFRSSTSPAEHSSSFPASLSFLYYLFPIYLWFHFLSIPGSNHYLPLSVRSFALSLSWLFVSAEVLFDYAQHLCPCATQVFIAAVIFTVREKHTNGCKLNLSFYESVTGPDLEPNGRLWRKPRKYLPLHHYDGNSEGINASQWGTENFPSIRVVHNTFKTEDAMNHKPREGLKACMKRKLW